MRKSFHTEKRKSSSRGFTLLLAVLISSLLLSVGLAIFNITFKELILSSAGRESQFALYAADTGAECALYWDFKHNAFSTSTTATISCAGGQVTNPDTGEATLVGGSGGPSTFEVNLSPLPYCAIVTVTKAYTPELHTVVQSRGYNTCDTESRERVERAINVAY